MNHWDENFWQFSEMCVWGTRDSTLKVDKRRVRALTREKRCTICYLTLHRLTNSLLLLLIPFSEGMVPITTTFSEHLTKVLRSPGLEYHPSLKFSKLSQTTNRWLEGLRFQHMMSSPTCNLKGSSTHTRHVALKQYFSFPRLLIYSYQAPPINMNPNNERSKLTNNKSFGPVNIFEHSRAGVKLCCDVRLCSAKVLNPSYFIDESVVQTISNLHSKHLLQCIGGDALSLHLFRM